MFNFSLSENNHPYRFEPYGFELGRTDMLIDAINQLYSDLTNEDNMEDLQVYYQKGWLWGGSYKGANFGGSGVLSWKNVLGIPYSLKPGGVTGNQYRYPWVMFEEKVREDYLLPSKIKEKYGKKHQFDFESKLDALKYSWMRGENLDVINGSWNNFEKATTSLDNVNAVTDYNQVIKTFVGKEMGRVKEREKKWWERYLNLGSDFVLTDRNDQMERAKKILKGDSWRAISTWDDMNAGQRKLANLLYTNAEDELKLLSVSRSPNMSKFNMLQQIMWALDLDKFFNKDGLIMGPINATSWILESLRGSEILEFGVVNANEDSMSRWGGLYNLLIWVLDSNGWKANDTVKKELLSGRDPSFPTAVARVFLDYFGYIVMPKWGKVENLFNEFLADPAGTDEKPLLSAISDVFAVLNKQKILDFIFDHLRFPNALIKLIDYSTEGLTEEQRKELDKYREKMGIPTPQKKKERIGQLEKIFSGLKSSSPDQLKSVLLSLADELKMADYEASYTHDGSYLEQLKKYYKHFWAAYKSKTRATDDESPVRMTLLGETKVLPTKSPEQERQEEEKRRMDELKKQEEQQKKDAEAAQ